MALTRDETLSLRMKHDDEKMLTKVLSKESWKSNHSFRVYYGDVPSGVPFVWESRPGTPKMAHLFHENIVPPLTPPPSYYTNINLNTSSKNNSKPKIFLQTLLTTINHNKSFSSFRHPPTYRRRRFSSWGGERAVENRWDQGFGIGIGKTDDDDRKKKFHGYNSSVYAVKKVFLAIFGLRSA